MKRRGGVIKGSLVLAASRVLASLCSLMLFWFIRRESIEGAGAFRTVLVFFLFSELLPLLGMHQYIIREVSTHQAEVKKHLLHSFLLALTVSLVVAVGLAALGTFGKYSNTVSWGLAIVALSLPATAAITVGQSVLVGLGQGATFGKLQALETFARTAAGTVLVLTGFGVLPVVLCFVVMRWLVIPAYWLSVRPYAQEGCWRFDGAFFRKFMGHLPIFAAIIICFQIIRFSAPMMLPWMKGDQAAGHFATAYVFLDMGLWLPTAFAANIMPLFAQKCRISMNRLSRDCRRAITLITLVILPVVTILSVMARPVLSLIFRADAEPSVAILRVLIWVCALMSIDQVLSTAIVACKKQKVDLQTLVVGASVMIFLLYVLIGRSAANGAAIAVLAGTIVIVVTRFVLVGRHIPRLNPLKLLWRPVIAAAAMAASMIFLPGVHWILGCAVGMLVYVAVSAAVGSFSAGQRRSMALLLQADAGKELVNDIEENTTTDQV